MPNHVLRAAMAIAAALVFLGFPLPAAAACDPARPISCGQVRVSGDSLYDDGGRWQVRGVAFFLPQYGINANTLRDDNYAAAKADGSLAYWLDRARDGLGANLLRVFIELPQRRDGAIYTPTSHATVYDFATEAGARGMRLGLVLHNSASWSMTPERAAWITGLIDTFAARGALPLLAYLSASNEINNYCGGHERDCFDSAPGVNAQPYVDAAVAWTAQFRAVVKARAPQLLVTVGISTEMGDTDNTRAAFNFFRPDSAGRTLASQVDFLAPHNFGGGAQGIYDDIRFVGYRGPIVLEEFGYPTDPFPVNRFFTEGPLRCRRAPLSPECFETAPYFVEANIQALRARPYAGAVAWMLADVREKNSDDACTGGKPSDLWTGLFAIGGAYCAGGTYTRGVGQPKATAVRICLYYTGDFFRCEPSAQVRAIIYAPVISR
ncbi:MAG: hypothetical protein DIU80_024740 [Chloroflexota bacterium]|nr:MAG: hypothetical protein DIU80_16055 [Chloroflexota bacterium]